jgi:hypothetical protein
MILALAVSSATTMASLLRTATLAHRCSFRARCRRSASFREPRRALPRQRARRRRRGWRVGGSWRPPCVDDLRGESGSSRRLKARSRAAQSLTRRRAHDTNGGRYSAPSELGLRGIGGVGAVSSEATGNHPRSSGEEHTMHAKTHQRATRSMRGRASAGALALLVRRPDLLRQDLVQPRELRPPAQARSEAQSQLWMAGRRTRPAARLGDGSGRPWAAARRRHQSRRHRLKPLSRVAAGRGTHIGGRSRRSGPLMHVAFRSGTRRVGSVERR